jgi:hypothetical protein
METRRRLMMISMETILDTDWKHTVDSPDSRARANIEYALWVLQLCLAQIAIKTEAKNMVHHVQSF